MSNNDLAGFVAPAQHLARALAADLSSFREDCLNWSARPSAHYGPFGTLGTDLLRQVVELVKQRNVGAKLDPMAQGHFQVIARKISEGARQLSAKDFCETHGLTGDGLLSLTATRLKDKVIMPLFQDIPPEPTPSPSRTCQPASPPSRPRPAGRANFTVIQGGLGPFTD